MATVPATQPVARVGMRMLFDRLADDWEQIRDEPVYRESFLAALRLLPNRFPVLQRPPATVLDVACGTGIATAVLRQCFPHARLTGLDVSERMVAHARELVAGAEFLVGSSFRLPFNDGAFELVTSLDGVFVIDELARVTAPDGAVMLVYSKGGECPVARRPSDLVREFEQVGMVALSEGGGSWVVWALKPVPKVI